MLPVQGNCSDPDAATALRLLPDLAAALLPLKPRQCLLLLPDTLIAVLRGSFWLDNVYLALAPPRFVPALSFLTVGLPIGEHPNVRQADVVATNVTLQGQGDRGWSAKGIVVTSRGSALLLQGMASHASSHDGRHACESPCGHHKIPL